jgi:hypothetical protein
MHLLKPRGGVCPNAKNNLNYCVDWEFSVSESEDLNKAIQAEINTDHQGALLHCFLENLDNPNPECTKKIRMIFVGVIPNYKDIIGQYNKSLTELSEERSLAYEKCE